MTTVTTSTLSDIRNRVASQRDWWGHTPDEDAIAQLLLAVNSATVSMGTFANPLIETGPDWTYSTWQLEEARLATLAVLDWLIGLESQSTP